MGHVIFQVACFVLFIIVVALGSVYVDIHRKKNTPELLTEILDELKNLRQDLKEKS